MAHGLFITCLADTLAPAVGRATVNVLERAGVEVEFPREQTCCGQMHFNAGHVDVAKTLARRFVEVFDPYEAIVTPSGSCAAHVRTHVPALVPDDRGVPGRTRELSELLVERGPVDLGSLLSWLRHVPPHLSFAAPAQGRRRPAFAPAIGRGR